MKTEIIAFLDKVQEMRQAQRSAWLEIKVGPIGCEALQNEVDFKAEQLQAQLVSSDNLHLTERARVIGELMLLSPKLDRQSMVYVDQLIDELKVGLNRKELANA